MIIYFADREMNILGHATSELRQGFVITEDRKADDVETGVASFSCRIGFTKEAQARLEKMANAGNYLLRSNDGENEFYTIIDSEVDTKNQEIIIYAEDAGLDLLNLIADAFEADSSYNAKYYINPLIADSGFQIGICEIPDSVKRQLKWESEATATERLASIATQFGGYEISYSFATKGLNITHKYIHFHKQRGNDNGVQLRLNKEVDRIITSKTVANLATAFVCEGGIPDDAENPITLKDYKYDDGDFYVDSAGVLKSRKALEKWSRHVWKTNLNQMAGYEGHITRPYSYNTTKQEELCSHAVTELKKYCDMEVNYEVDIKRLPEGVKIGDRVNIVDDAGELYLSTRLLKLETSVIDKKYTATLGEHIIKKSGISQKVADLAAEFAKTTVSVTRALAISDAAKEQAAEALEQAELAAEEAIAANTASEEAQAAAEVAKASAITAEAQALAAEAAVDRVESSVQSIQNSVENAQKAADNAEAAATTAQEQAAAAARAANSAAQDADTALGWANEAISAADEAVGAADEAITTAGEAKTAAQSASDTAAAAKLDAEQAERDVAAFGENLETYKTTMEADYARKTDLTETTTSLQAQITANAGQISSTLTKVTTIDETANDAKAKAEDAQAAADAAQAQADQATADAEAAQDAADEAAAAAANAQSEADKANAAAATAQGVADKAEQALEVAKADLATVQGRVDATEEEIAAAQQAVDTAQAAADTAKADAAAAAQKALDAQNTADTAVTNAANAQTTATNAANAAATAQQTADQAKGDASAAQTRANEAASAAAAAQSTANTAVTNAATAQAQADQAAADAAAAQSAADAADAKAAQAQTDLNTAKQNLADTVARVDATEEEIAAAQAAVEAAQAAAEAAQAEAEAAQATADTAKENADTAQKAADDAQEAADNAQEAANEAKNAADQAQADANALAIRVTTAETNITQTNERIDLCATKQEFNDLSIGGRNLLLNTKTLQGDNVTIIGTFGGISEGEMYKGGQVASYSNLSSVTAANYNSTLIRFENLYYDAGATYILSFDVKVNEVNENNTGASLYIQNGFSLNILSVKSTEWQRCSVQVKIGANKDVSVAKYLQLSFRHSYSYCDEISFANFKLEKGSKATDWTPAPEDVTAEMLAEVEQVRGQLTEAKSEIITTAEGITLQHLENYTEKTDFDTFKENIEAELSLDSNGISMRFKTTEEGISRAEGAAATAQQTADAASGAAATAQQTADTASGAAATAQQTADTANGAAATAQQTADTAKNAADQAQADANALAIRVTTAETNITQTGERIDLCATKQEFNDLSIGGRNLLVYGTIQTPGTDYGHTDLKADATAGIISGTGAYYLRFDVELIPNTQYTISADKVTTSGDYNNSCNVVIYDFENNVGVQTAGTLSGGNPLTFTTDEGVTYEHTLLVYVSGATSTAYVIEGLKLEKGSKATDWTPAPEDVTAEMLAEVEQVRGQLTEAKSEIITSAEGITLQHLENYTEKTDFDTFKENTETALYLESGVIGMRFKETEQTISDVEGDLQGKFTELQKFITFTTDGIKISTGENSMTLELDNDIISFKKNGVQFGWWDGVDFHTGNIIVDVNERAQFGNFAFVPRSDGSLMFLKVGD